MRTINIEELYNLHYSRIFHLSYSITRDYQLAEDVVQETFIKAMKKIHTIQGEDTILAWLRVIAKRTAIDMLRSERKKLGILMEQDMLVSLGSETGEDIEKEVEYTFLVDQVSQSIKCLQTIYQDVMFLKVKDDMKEKEIAEQLNVSLSSVKSRIHRARKYLMVMVREQISA